MAAGTGREREGERERERERESMIIIFFNDRWGYTNADYGTLILFSLQ